LKASDIRRKPEQEAIPYRLSLPDNPHPSKHKLVRLANADADKHNVKGWLNGREGALGVDDVDDDEASIKLGVD
jgi:hypothetical protein